jgi:hypothetical protein
MSYETRPSGGAATGGFVLSARSRRLLDVTLIGAAILLALVGPRS